MQAMTMIGALTGSALLALFSSGASAAPARPGKELPPKPSVADVVKASQPGDWRPLDP